MMAVQWFRGGPEFEAARIKSGRELAGLQGIGQGVGGGVRALQRAVQNEKALKAEETMLEEQLPGEEAPAAEAPLGAEGEAPIAPEGSAIPEVPIEQQAPPPEAGGGGFDIGALLGRGRDMLGAVGRVAVGLPAEQGLTERVGALRGQLAAEETANKDRIARMTALSRIGSANPETLGAIQRAMPDQFPEFPEAAAEQRKPISTMGGNADAMAMALAEERGGPGAEPTYDERLQAVDAVRKRFATPFQESHTVDAPVLDAEGQMIPDGYGGYLMATDRRAGRMPSASGDSSLTPMPAQDPGAVALRRKLEQAMTAVPTTSTGTPLWSD